MIIQAEKKKFWTILLKRIFCRNKLIYFKCYIEKDVTWMCKLFQKSQQGFQDPLDNKFATFNKSCWSEGFVFEVWQRYIGQGCYEKRE